MGHFLVSDKDGDLRRQRMNAISLPNSSHDYQPIDDVDFYNQGLNLDFFVVSNRNTKTLRYYCCLVMMVFSYSIDSF